MTYLMGPPDPERLMRVFTSGDVATKENKWQRFNVWRWRNDEYDRLYRAAETEVDPVKRAALFIRMNDLVIQSGIVIPIALRAKAAAMSNRLRGIEHNPYEVDFWSREAERAVGRPPAPSPIRNSGLRLFPAAQDGVGI
jgi:peptide/nickel transport system substrate-binding protein